MTRISLKKYRYIFAASLLLFVLTTLLGAPLWGFGGHHVKFPGTAILYAFVVAYGLHFYQSKKERIIATMIIISFPVLTLSYFHLADFEKTLVSFPSYLSYFYGIGIGLLIFHSSGLKKIALCAFLLMSSSWMAVAGYDAWMHYINFGYVTPENAEKLGAYRLTTKAGRAVGTEALENKIVVLDFWNTACGVCFQKFPKVEALHKKFKDSNTIRVISVNVPLERDTAGQAYNTIDRLGYTFPVLTATGQLPEQFGVKVYPTVVIVKDNKMVFRGRLEDVETTLQGLE